MEKLKELTSKSEVSGDCYNAKKSSNFLCVSHNVENFYNYPVFDSSLPTSNFCESLIPLVPGVYFFHDLRGIHYIGETLNLRSRFKQHTKEEKNKKLSIARKATFGKMYFSWVKCSSKMEALMFQKKWIRIFNPKCNKILYKPTN